LRRSDEGGDPEQEQEHILNNRWASNNKHCTGKKKELKHTYEAEVDDLEEDRVQLGPKDGPAVVFVLEIEKTPSPSIVAQSSTQY
jgi:hypothetical protein